MILTYYRSTLKGGRIFNLKIYNLGIRIINFEPRYLKNSRSKKGTLTSHFFLKAGGKVPCKRCTLDTRRKRNILATRDGE